MFPLSDAFLNLLPWMVGFGLTSLLVALGHARVGPGWLRWAPVPLWIVGLWYFARDFHGEYAWLAAMIWSGAGLILLIAGTGVGLMVGWVLGLRRSARGERPLVVALCGVALLPALAFTGVLLLRQTVPDAPFANDHLPVCVGGRFSMSARNSGFVWTQTAKARGHEGSLRVTAKAGRTRRTAGCFAA